MTLSKKLRRSLCLAYLWEVPPINQCRLIIINLTSGVLFMVSLLIIRGYRSNSQILKEALMAQHQFQNPCGCVLR